VLFLFAAFAFMRVVTGNMGPATADVAVIRAVLIAIFTFGLLALAAWLAYKILPSRAVGVVALTFAILLTLYGIRSMVLLNYRHGDVPIEMLVYTQSAPDVPLWPTGSCASRVMKPPSMPDAQPPM